MYLSQVTIQHFRNIADLTVNLTPGLNVIVGINNIGKTNFAEAILAALGQATINEDDLPVDTSGRRSELPIHVSLVFAALTADEQARYIDILDFKPDNPDASTASIHFECIWQKDARRPNWTRWAGNRRRNESAVPDDVLQSIRVVLLNALRNATAELMPGRQSKLGRLLRLMASDNEKNTVTQLFKDTNESVSRNELVVRTQKQIQNTLTGASGKAFAQDILIGTSEPRFEAIVNSLKLVLRGNGTDGQNPSFELDTNGLGYNNLIYIATVLSELSAAESDTPLLIVEEPEAHL